jgi:DNA-binding MarR family transcriptional regulator
LQLLETTAGTFALVYRLVWPSAAFLLAQVGAHAASQFAARLAVLAGALGMQASRLVALVDELETRGLIERRENRDDRRSYALHLTGKGRGRLEAVGRVGREHQQAIFEFAR